MSTVYERNAPRLRAALTLLDRAGQPMKYRELFSQLERDYPPIDDDLDATRDGQIRWQNDLLFQSVNLVKAGWMLKDGRGSWSITEAGREALRRIPQPTEFQRASLRRYYEWVEQQKETQRRAWLIRGSSVLGANLVPEWLAGGWVSLPASQLRQIDADISPDDLAAAAAEDYDHLKYQEQKSKVDEIVAFVTRIQSGDVVTTTSEGGFYVGDVTGELEWRLSEEGRSNLRRAVDWRNPDAPIDFAALPDPLPAKLRSGSAVIDLTAQLDLIDDLTITREVSDERVEGAESRPAHEHLPEPTQQLAGDLLLDLTWLKKVRDLLDERKQIVLYGPPGTGKTFLAQKLAEHLVGQEQVRLVQFHPAYSYEDFFEGYRPEQGEGGTIGFRLRSGPLRRLASDAAEHRDEAFVLIIDEINRADLAKVFGELYFLLEYRKEAVQLMYSGSDDSFSLPDNLYIIGTMNTADRSIALVDAAMRRRFGFVALDMTSGPTKSLLRNWSAKHKLPMLAADLLDELNRRLDDPDFQVGPSYFMKRRDLDAFSTARLEMIWDSDILPLLQEHYYGQWEAIADKFSLKSLLAAVSRVAPDQSEAAADVDLTAPMSGTTAPSDDAS
jgi:5-methylcytosine-specific restriction protein B